MATPQPAAEPFDVEGKRAIITGGGSGIGYCFAKLLLSRGCSVLIADLGLRPEAQSLVDEYDGSKGGPRALFVKVDVAIWDDLSRMFDVADAELGGCDIICPGAGVFEPKWSAFWWPPGHTESKDDPHGGPDGIGHYRLLDINITHPIRATQLAISRWLNPTNGDPKASLANPKRIVHISSVAGQLPSFAIALYIASKHAISGFIRSMPPLETHTGIRVNGVAPGVIKTPLWTDAPDALSMFDESRDTWIEPEEVAEQMLRCMVDDSIGEGTVWEITKGASRKVDFRNDPGPTGPGSVISNGQQKLAAALGELAKDGWGVVKT